MKNNNQNNRNRNRNSGYENEYGRQGSGSYNQYTGRNDFSEYDDDAGYANQNNVSQRSHYGFRRDGENYSPQYLQSEFGRSQNQGYSNHRRGGYNSPSANYYEGGANYNSDYGNRERDSYEGDYYDKTHARSGMNRSSIRSQRNDYDNDYYTDDVPGNRGFYNSDYGRENRGYEERNPRSYQPYRDQSSYGNYGGGNRGTENRNRGFGQDDWNYWNNGNGQHRGKGPRGYHRSDERIQDDINDRLSDEGTLDATDIEVKVLNGEVTLTGNVADKQSKRLAEDIAEEVSGVSNVENKIRVSKEGNTSQKSIGSSASAAEHKKTNANSSSEKKEKTHQLN